MGRLAGCWPRFGGVLALGLGLVGCAGSPPARYYTLRTLPEGAAAVTTPPTYLLEVLPVAIPAQVDEPYLMLRSGPGGIAPALLHRWAAPLQQELQAALSDVLKQSLQALEVRALRAAVPPAAPLWRIELDVQRFDMVAQRAATLDATWRIRPVNTPGRPLVCRSVITVPATGQGIAPLVKAQQQATALLGATIAAAIRAGGQSVVASIQPAVQNLGCIAESSAEN